MSRRDASNSPDQLPSQPTTPAIRIVVCDGDETGQELLVQALRVFEPGVLNLPIELIRYERIGFSAKGSTDQSSSEPAAAFPA